MRVLVLTRGSIADRPWAQTLGALARRQFTGQLSLQAEDGKQFAIAFDHGMVVGAASPIANDAIVRIALTNHFIAASQVALYARRIAASNHADEIDALVELASLTADQEIALRERAIQQRAARTFSIDRGTFVLEDTIAIPTSPVIVDPLGIIYFGVRKNLSEQRLLDDLRWMGTYFEVSSHAQDELMRYGFGAEEQPILEAVRRGTSVPALEAAHRELDPRTMQAVLFTLAACGTAVGSSPANIEAPVRASVPKFAASSSPNVQRIQSSEPLVVRMTPDELAKSQEEWRSMGTPGLTPRTLTPMPGRTPTPSSPSTPRTSSPRLQPLVPSRTATPSPSSLGVVPARTATPIAQRAQTAPVRAPTVPADAPLDLGIEPDLDDAQTTLVDPKVEAAAAYRRGEAALASSDLDTAIAELSRAAKLEPEHADYAAMLAWARFCAAKDRNAVAEATRKAIQQYAHKADKPIVPTLLLGKVERLLGRDKEALVHFQRVLELKPRHPEAAAEIRVIELRAAATPKGGGGLFGRKH